MKLLHHLFNLLDERMDAPTEGRFRLRLNAEHPIFAAHFPGRPTLPGVCTLQLVSELAERMAGRPLTLRTAKNMKFLAPIHPEATPEVEVHLSMDGGRVTAQVEDGPVCHAKLSLRYE